MDRNAVVNRNVLYFVVFDSIFFFGFMTFHSGFLGGTRFLLLFLTHAHPDYKYSRGAMLVCERVGHRYRVDRYFYCHSKLVSTRYFLGALSKPICITKSLCRFLLYLLSLLLLTCYHLADGYIV